VRGFNEDYIKNRKKMTKLYKTADKEAFIPLLQDGFAKIDDKARTSGVNLDEHDLYYTILANKTGYTIVLITFDADSELPRTFLLDISR
jgi:hypothetical protein